MSWRDDLGHVRMPDGRELIGASFRGVPFFVSSAERIGGRRTVTHEFPLRDDPYIDDLGRKSRTFPIDGYLLGDGYVRHREALASALEDSSGPGELVHPYYGVRRAICSDFSIKESSAEGGIATFSITFQEAPDRPTAPTEEIDLSAQLEEAAEAAYAAARAELVEEFDAFGLANFALDSAAAALETATAAMYAALGALVESAQPLARLNQDVKGLVEKSSALAKAPGDAFDGFASVLRAQIAELADPVPNALLWALFQIFDKGLGAPVIVSTPTRIRERRNQDALNAAIRRIVIIEAARNARRIAFPTIEDATAARSRIIKRLDTTLTGAGYIAYPAMADLRAALVLAVPGESVYSRIITVERNSSVPSLLLSYQLFGSVNQEQDLIARNKISHPGFMSGRLKALSNG